MNLSVFPQGPAPRCAMTTPMTTAAQEASRDEPTAPPRGSLASTFEGRPLPHPDEPVFDLATSQVALPKDTCDPRLRDLGLRAERQQHGSREPLERQRVRRGRWRATDRDHDRVGRGRTDRRPRGGSLRGRSRRRGRHRLAQARPRTRSISRPRTRSPSARSPLCSNSLVSQARRPLICAAVSTAKARSTYRSLT